jgi:hypothetical protein
MTPEDAKELLERTAAVESTYFGYRTSRLGVEETVGVDDDHRLLHTLVVGPTGYGKTQTLVHTALQDAYKGRGFCVVLPKGDGIDELLRKLPEDRLEDVRYVNPAREQVPAINVLEPYLTDAMNQAQREHQKEIIVADLIDLFKRQSESWGDRFGRILETLLRAHLDKNIYEDDQATLLDVFECVVNSDALTQLIDTAHDPVVREQLVRVKEDLSSYELEPLQRRLNDFMTPTIRNVIGAAESGIDLHAALNENRIILVDIQKGEVGDTVAQIIGSIIITKVWAAAQSRIVQPASERTPFHLYVDELQNFAGEGSNLARILAEARECRLGCWVVVQYLGQLPSEMRQAVVNNCRTKLVFNPVGSDNVGRIASMLRGIDRQQLQALGEYRGAVQTPGICEQSTAVLIDTYPPWTADQDRDLDRLKQELAARTTASAHAQTSLSGSHTSLGQSANAGGEIHAELLRTAKEYFDTRKDVSVTLLYQDEGADKPDGYVHRPDDTLVYLEAEHATLQKPAKVLTNALRAADDGHDVIFVVEDENAAKLSNILTDPVNRRGNSQQDDEGSFDYYTVDGEPFTAIDRVATVEYRIFEAADDTLSEYKGAEEVECPELDEFTQEELEQFCLYRDPDGFCDALGQPCVFID